MLGGGRLVLSLVLALPVVGGCASVRIPPESLPEAPIALVHWEGKDASKRAEAIAKAEEAPPATDPDPSGERELAEMRVRLRGIDGMALWAALERGSPGRLMLFWPRTGELERVDAAPPNAIPLAWSEDHRRLLFVSGRRDGREQLYEYHLERRDLRPVTYGPAEHPAGDYAPDGGWVVQRLERRTRSAGTEASLLELAPTGRREQRIARDGPVGSIDVTPDGRHFVYEKIEPRPRRNGATTYDSHVAIREVAPGADESVLLRGREPTLTPDGQWIVFASASSAGYRLRRMRLDGTIRVPIGPGGSEERMPAVSPDGGFVAFIEGERGRLVVRRYDGKQERVLLSEGWSEHPVW